MYAYAVDGLDWEQREHFDERLNATTDAKTDAQPSASPREQARAQQQLMAAMQKASVAGR